MTAITNEPAKGAVVRALGEPACPSCGGEIAVDAQFCPACGFTGNHTMAMFSNAPPPLLPVIDAAGIWSDGEIHAITAAGNRIRKRYPQLRFHVCSVMLPSETNLSVFGFWLLNVCPLDAGETREERAWVVLLLINSRTGQATVVPGYSVEHWLCDRDWMEALETMCPAWVSGKPAAAVLRFFKTSAGLLDRVWKARITRKSGKSKRSRRSQRVRK